MANFSEIARKKVLGVPAIYLAGAFVVILAVVAYKMKSTTTPDATTDSTDTSGTGAAPTANPYDSLNPDGNGTVVVQQLGPNANTDTEPVVKTNSDWVNEGAVWLGKNKSVAGTQAIAALNKYVNGQDRTYDEEQWVNAWIAQDGPPPDGVAEGGNVGNKPAVRQLSSLPGYHTVMGNTDDSYGELATIYYGHSDQQVYDLLQAANDGKVPPSGPFAVGTKVYIPAYTAPQYYTLPQQMTEAQLAAKNGLTVGQLRALNNVSRAVWAKGSRARVK